MLDRKGFNELGVSKMMNAEEHGDKLPDTQIARDGSVPVAAKDTNILPNDGRVEFVKPERLKDRGISKDQIMIDTKILTVSDEFLKYIGLDPNSVASSKGWSNYLVHSTDDSASFVIDQLHADLILKALAARMRTDEEIQMLHKPQVLAQSGKKIEITVLKSHYYMLSSPNEPNALSVEPESKFNRIDLGTTIRLTPNLTPDGKNVELDFEWEYRRLRGFKEQTDPNGNVQKMPIVDIDRIKTPCTVPDGKTLLIAGKKITEQKKKEPKKPLLADLPLIGGLFSSPTKTEETRNLLILIKPIINPPKKAPPKQQPIDPNEPLIKKLEEKFKRSDEPK
jgi:type II secretory pathway component GspD/PulD (secretin)